MRRPASSEAIERAFIEPDVSTRAHLALREAQRMSRLEAEEADRNDDGEEHSSEVPELIGINWFEFFGFEDDELLETVPEHEFAYIEGLMKKS